MSNENSIEKTKVDVAHAEADVERAVEELQRATHELEEATRELAEAEQHRVIHFILDGEPEETERHEWTPNQIIEKFGKKSPASHYLIRIEGGKKVESYEGKGDKEIRLRDGMCFQMVSTGPTPVSDGGRSVGVSAFIEGLKLAGYSPSTIAGSSNLVTFEYEVLSGKFAGRKVRLGFTVPDDFPMHAPIGPHVSPHIHPINTQSGPHPLFGVHEEQSRPFLATGDAWQYWSRPFVDWEKSKKSVATYLSHVWKLWDSQ